MSFISKLKKDIKNKIKYFFSHTKSKLQPDKKKAVIIANCQGAALVNILKRVPSFDEKYEIIQLPPIHLLTDKDEEKVVQSLNSADLFLYQPISESFGKYSSDNLLKYLKEEAVAISFPVVYFTGYNPETIYLKDTQGKKATIGFEYHDLNILSFFNQGFTVEETVKKIQKPEFYSVEFIEKNIKQSLSSLREREEGIDIKVLKYIEDNSHGKRLFVSMNHPVNELLYEVVSQILIKVKLADNSADFLLSSPFNKELLGRNKLFVYPSIKKYFNIETEYDVIMENKEYSLSDYIKVCFDLYEDNQDIVSYNLELYKNRII